MSQTARTFSLDFGEVVFVDGKCSVIRKRGLYWQPFNDVYGQSRLSMAIQVLEIERILNGG